MAKICFHIGCGKTGTSSLQCFLTQNRNVLHSNGLLYPDAGTEYNGTKANSHHGLAVMGFPAMHDEVRDQYRALKKEIQKSGCNQVLLSSENFCYLQRSYVEEIAHELDSFELSVVLYVRNQPELIESTYLQWKKVGALRDGTIRDFYEQHSDGFDFFQRVSPWSDIVGAQNITVRLYDRSAVTDTCRDLLSFFNLQQLVPEELYRANESLLPEFSHLLGLIDAVAVADSERELIVDELVRLSVSLRAGSKSRLIDPELRAEITERYQDSNQRLASLFLSQKEGKLVESWAEISSGRGQ